MGFGILRDESEWEQGSFARSSICGYCKHEIHEGPCKFARDAKFKEGFQDTDGKNVVSNLLPQDIKPICSSELEGVMNCNLLDVDGGNKDINSLSTSSSEETLIQVYYFKLTIAN
jgi:hypothetical protein